MESNLKQNLTLSVANGYGIVGYQKFKTNVSLINDFFEDQLLAYYLMVIGLYCQIPEAVLGNFFRETKLVLLFYMIVDAVVWGIAAEFHNSVQRTILQRHESNYCRTVAIPFCCQGTKINLIDLKSTAIYDMQQDIRQIRQQMDSLKIKSEFYFEPVALSCRVFKVTYGFLSAVSLL